MNEFLVFWVPLRKVTVAIIGFISLLIHFNSFGTVLQKNSARVEAVDTQRYLALLLLNISENETQGPELDLIRMAKQYGLNTVYLTVSWDKVYLNSPTDTPKWTRFDDQVKLATSLGMKVAIRIHLGRHTTRYENFWKPQNGAIDNFGKILNSGYKDTSFGFDQQDIVKKGIDFVKEVTQRYKYLQTQKSLLFIAVTNTPTQEAGYPAWNLADEKEKPAAFDYSPTMISGFRTWLSTNYKKIDRLNYLWGTSFKSFDQAYAPTANWDPFFSFGQRAGKDWYLYRHLVLKNYINQMIDAVKSVDSSIKYLSDFGSVYDNASASRGTLAYKDLSEKADGIKSNDDPTADHHFSMDILRSEAPADFIVGNEAFYNSTLGAGVTGTQINENFSNGANFISVLVSTTTDMQVLESTIRQAGTRWLNTPMQPVTYRDSTGYRLSSAVEKGGSQNVIFNDWSKKAYANPASPKPVHIKLVEDLLSAEYWVDASNHAPYVFRPIPMQIIAVNKDFAFRLPLDTFSDGDGTIVSTRVGALPAWLKFNAGQLTGRPTALGDFRILVQGVDDEGATADAYLTIRVDSKDNTNKPPTVSSNFSNLKVAVNEPFTFTVPKTAFVDSDGTIAKVEASELPSWLTFSNGILTGRPAATGDYRISFKAYDNQDAFVEIYFNVQVVEPQFLNNLPYITATFPDKYAQVNHPFTFILPSDIFADSDGYISSISVQNRPSWLDFSLNVFSGTPTEEGEYRLIIRAYDNSGGSVETVLVIKVEIPQIRFEIVKGGRAVDQTVIRSLSGNDVLAYEDLPSLLNIYAYGNFEYDQVSFNLNGPYRKISTTSKFPYALFEGETGFAPYVGRYTLTVIASNKDSAVVTNSIQFSISSGDSVNITKNITEWQFYPNPVQDIFNFKLPDNSALDQYQYSIVYSTGQRMPVSTGITIQDNLVNMDLTRMGLTSGIYYVRVESDGKLVKQFRVFKK
ncbi:putative Ig domain-containing protein [Dyadobacter sp. CY356]|uniref:putative Ig domain-containing protein n=1 Tax=Dyadobacter sp. CY356 TaxID=2906442 RepID=UPI001F3FC2E5|nr:putative Ig domain-containing protein [Dyadobacter sp. CY356]MCF0057846.1 putative Ig domain-containing protein [Dyadobacter sp. CY356]